MKNNDEYSNMKREGKSDFTDKKMEHLKVIIGIIVLTETSKKVTDSQMIGN